MAKFEQRNDCGVLFKNAKKTSEKQPDFIGEIMENGVLWRLAGWTKSGKSGKFISLKRSEFRPEKSEAKEQDNPFMV